MFHCPLGAFDQLQKSRARRIEQIHRVVVHSLLPRKKCMEFVLYGRSHPVAMCHLDGALDDHRPSAKNRHVLLETFRDVANLGLCLFLQGFGRATRRVPFVSWFLALFFWSGECVPLAIDPFQP